MNNGSQSYLVIIVIIFAVAMFSLLGIYLNKKYSQNSQKQVVPPTTVPESNQQLDTQDTGPKKGQLNYQEPQTTVLIGTAGVTKGTFEKAENGEIYLSTDVDVQTKLPLTLEEVVISCTKQDLSTATELDFNLVSKVNVFTADNLNPQIAVGTPVVLFAQNVEGVNRVHTVAMPESRCL